MGSFPADPKRTSHHGGWRECALFLAHVLATAGSLEYLPEPLFQLHPLASSFVSSLLRGAFLGSLAFVLQPQTEHVSFLRFAAHVVYAYFLFCAHLLSKVCENGKLECFPK